MWNHHLRADSSSTSEQLAAINERLDVLLSIKDWVDYISMLDLKLDELLSLKPEVEVLKSVVNEVQSSLDSLSENYDSLLARSLARDETIAELTTQVQPLETSQIKVLPEQYSRMSNLEIHRLPTNPDENLMEVLKDLSFELSIDSFSEDQVVAVHRLAPRRNGPALVLVRFSAISIRDKWLLARSKLPSLDKSNEHSKLFFAENLSKSNRERF
ncbi:uncharacterized protein LOC144127650 [Amblyomma americanum]